MSAFFLFYKKGTSLVELIAVIVIMGIIAGIAIPTTIAVINRQKRNAAVKSMEALVSTCKNLILEAQTSATGSAVYLTATYGTASGTPTAFTLKNDDASGADIEGFSAADLNVDSLKYDGTITCTFTITGASWSWSLGGTHESNGIAMAIGETTGVVSAA